MTDKVLTRSFTILGVVGAVTLAPAADPPREAGSKLQRWTNLSYEHREVPLFSIYGPFERQPDVSVLLNAKSALDVFDFQEVTLAEDGQGVALRLADQERRVLRRLAQKHAGKWFVVLAPPRDIYRGEPAVAATRTTPEMAQGLIVFPHPQCGAIAQRLRHRFRIAEFRLVPR